KYDDEEPLGINIFRTAIGDDKLENLTLSRTFFGRSEIRNVSFRGSDLSESTFCWNDFIAVDFSNCDLSRSDLRAALFEDVKFVGADLNGCDLRRSDFLKCDFSNANLQKAKLTTEQMGKLNLSTGQREQVDWQEDDGEEPDGG